VAFKNSPRRPVDCSSCCCETLKRTTSGEVLLRLCDRDGTGGKKFQEATAWVEIREVLTAPQSPWQNDDVERLSDPIGPGAWIT
jgi:hypothetical protein